MGPVLALASHIPSSEIGLGCFQETGGVGRMVRMARSNLGNVPRPEPGDGGTDFGHFHGV